MCAGRVAWLREPPSVSILRRRLCSLLAFVGFSRFYLHGRSYPGRPIPEPIKLLIISHAVTISLWLVFSVLQATLVSVRNVSCTSTWDVPGGLAAINVVLGVWLAIMSAVTPADLGMTPKQFMAVPMISVLRSGCWWCRDLEAQRPAIHRSMIIAATLVTMSAAVSRIDTLNKLYGHRVEPCSPFALTMLLAVLLLAVRCALIRSL